MISWLDILQGKCEGDIVGAQNVLEFSVELCWNLFHINYKLKIYFLIIII